MSDTYKIISSIHFHKHKYQTKKGAFKMPLLCDFTLIVGDSPVTIGDTNPQWEVSFDSGARDANSPAFLIFNVRGLTHSTRDVEVKVNGIEVGRIHNYRPGGADIDRTTINQPEKLRQQDHWYTQMIALDGNKLNSRDNSNRINIKAVDFPERRGTNVKDDFQIKDMICFFHQRS
ncbi:MAG: hypothetical protein AAF572_15465 [Cyanobacteria bacterium P01_B01_bin.77]